MKKSEDILLEETKSVYTRQLSAWTELTHKSHNFLQLNGLLLSMIFIGAGLQRESVLTPLLTLSALFIIGSIVCGILAARSRSVKEIKIALDVESDMAGKERKIVLALIKTYTTAQKNIISEYNARMATLNWSVRLLSVGLVVLLAFIFGITMPIAI